MNTIASKFQIATKKILEKNMQINDDEYKNKKCILVYDLDSPLSREISKAYITNVQSYPNSEIIDFNQANKEELKEKLLNLEEKSCVILVQSTNFRLDKFRIRMNLHNRGIGCLEHNHLGYIKDNQIENYANAIEYKTPFYVELGEKLKKLIDNAENMQIICHDGSIMNINGGFEDMKQNSGDYNGKKRGGTFPVGENFTEAKSFDNVNGELSIYAFPDKDFQVEFHTPFKIQIKESKITCDDSLCPEYFRETLEIIKKSEDNEVMCRELGFGFNAGITKEKPLSDINAFERICGFHMSLGKKHQIYRKKIHKDISQRYHIDIFPDVKEIFIDDIKIFENEKYII